jgi:hypothetical protein
VSEQDRLAGGVTKGIEQNGVVGGANRTGGEDERRQNGEKDFHKAPTLATGFREHNAKAQPLVRKGSTLAGCLPENNGMETVAQPPPQPGWWSRNWKWFVPTGCCLTPLVLGAAFAAFLVLVVFGALKQSDAYKMAVARAKADSRVVTALGTPIEEGWWLSGKTNVNGGSGDADLSIPISGPKGKGTIYAVATKSAGDWSYSKLQVKIESTDETIDLGPSL